MDSSLLPFFRPQGVVVIGASTSPEKLGYGVARNLVKSGYQGAIHFMSQKQGELFERPLYTSLSDVPDPIDLAILIVPTQSTPQTIEDCGRRGIKAAALGDARKAIEFYEQALLIDREIGDRRGEGADLSNIASEYSSLAEFDKAIHYYSQALENAREIGNKYGESKRLNGLADVLIEKRDLQNAISHSRESLQIGRQMSSPEVCIESGTTLATALLLAEKLGEALQSIQEAGKYERENFEFNVSVLHGIIVLRQGDVSTARKSFARAIAQADEILAKTPDYYSALDAKGLALCGLAICRGGSRSARTEIDQAIETFRPARKIAPHAGVVKSVLRLFDELAKCDSEGILKDVREVIAPTVTP